MTVINNWRQSIRKITYFSVISVLVLFTTPTLVFAEGEMPTTDTQTTQTEPETTPPAITTSPEPTPPTPGPQQPTGADAETYTQDPDTGVWTNGYYEWDPATNQTRPLTPQEYSYNPTTGMWDTIDYVYDAPSGTYIPKTTSTASLPEDAKVVDGPATSPGNGATSDSMPLSGASVQSSLNSNNASQPNNTINSNSANSGIFDLFYNALISNTIDSTAHSGDALVAMNTVAGNAVSGSASAIANIINLLQSSWDTTAGAFTSFVSNLFGDVVGDLFLDPGQAGNVNVSADNDLTVNSSTNAAISNNINLQATSGDATVTQNTTAGDATSGNATAVANLVNAINSSIAAQQSFLGVLNIFGNLNGDILMPPELLQSLMAANAVGSLDTSQITNTNILANFNNNSTITNNIDASATSGNASVTNNTSVGNATSGDASTNLTVLNLTGRQVVGKDAMLVFVNVLGEWVGMIVNAPVGSTSAALGGGITQNNTQNNDLTVNSDNTQAITNNINAHATSGDATVSDNTQAGNATSGDANTAVNLLNITDSQFSLSNWFGILFINVFGTWNGSFGIDTAAGTVANPSPNPAITTPANESVPVSEVHAFRFVPTDDGQYTMQATDEATATTALASAHVLDQAAPSTPQKQAQHDKDTAKANQNNWWFSAVGVMLAASLLGTERVISRRNEGKA